MPGTVFFVVCLTALVLPNLSLPLDQSDLQEQYGEALEAIFGMGIRLQAILEDPKTPNNKNFIVSPLSAATVIAQLMIGSEGEFRDQLYYLLSLTEKKQDKYMTLNIFENDGNSTYLVPYAKLHVQLGNLLRVLRADGQVNPLFTLEESSAFFVDSGIKLNKSFRHQMNVLYKTEILQISFQKDPVAAQNVVNGWASLHTKGLIPTILHSPPPPTTAAILANAIYFYGEWETPFSQELNKQGLFNVSADKNVNVTYMTGFVEDILYAEKEDYKIISLPYKKKNLGMYIILPNIKNPYAYNIRGFVENLKYTDLTNTIKNAGRQDVVVRLPKMALSSSINLLEPLQKFKVYKKQSRMSESNDNNIVENLENKVAAFNNFNATDLPEIELTTAAEGGPLKLSGILQQMTLSVNEKGTEAAVITSSFIDYMGGSKNFIVNRPFVFFIRHEPTSAVLFWGTIVNPSNSSLQ